MTKSYGKLNTWDDAISLEYPWRAFQKGLSTRHYEFLAALRFKIPAKNRQEEWGAISNQLNEVGFPVPSFLQLGDRYDAKLACIVVLTVCKVNNWRLAQ